MQRYRAFSVLFAPLMVATSIPLGCGGTLEDYVVLSPSTEEIHQSSQPQASPTIVRQLKECIESADYRWTESTYAFQYDLTATEERKVDKVKLRDTTLEHAALQACFERVLLTMAVPEEAIRLRSSKPFSGGENSSFSRKNVGVVQAAAAPIAMAPIIIPAIGVVIIVAISIEIIRNATSGPDCKQIKQECIVYCSDTTLPTSDYGWKFPKMQE